MDQTQRAGEREKLREKMGMGGRERQAGRTNVRDKRRESWRRGRKYQKESKGEIKKEIGNYVEMINLIWQSEMNNRALLITEK